MLGWVRAMSSRELFGESVSIYKCKMAVKTNCLPAEVSKKTHTAFLYIPPSCCLEDKSFFFLMFSKTMENGTLTKDNIILKSQ